LGRLPVDELPGVPDVAKRWTVGDSDLLLGTEIEQLVTLRDVEVTRWLDRIRARDERRVATASPHTTTLRVL